MGADNFSTAAFGKTPKEAFSAARERAQHNSGHGGYTGTIAEKHDFVHVPLPKGVTIPAFLKLLDDAEEFAYADYAKERLADHERYGKGKRKMYAGRTLKQAQAEVAKVQRKVDRFWAKVAKKPGLEKAIRDALPFHSGDKWGPALCLGPLTGKAMRERMSYAAGVNSTYTDEQGWTYKAPRGAKMYLFTGYASS